MALRQVLKAQEEWRTTGNRRFPRGRVMLWLTLECKTPEGAHHHEQRLVQLARDKTFTAPQKVKCYECLGGRFRRGHEHG